MKLNSKHFVITMTSFVGIVYLLCAALVLMAPVTSIKVANLAFHGLDLTKITKTIGFVDIVYGFVVSIIATIIYSAIFVAVWNYFYNKMEVK